MYPLREKDYKEYHVRWGNNVDEFVWMFERWNYGSEIIEDTPRSLLGPEGIEAVTLFESGHVVRRFPNDDAIVQEELLLVLDRMIQPEYVTTRPRHVQPEFWKWAFLDTDPSHEFRLVPRLDTPVKLTITHAHALDTRRWKNVPGPFFIIKGSLTLLLLLTQQRYPLAELNQKALSDLEEEWDQWLDACMEMARLHAPVRPFLIVPDDVLLSVFDVLKGDSPGTKVLKEFVEEAWLFEETTPQFTWTPVHIRDKKTRDLLVAWTESPRIRRPDRSVPTKDTRYYLNGTRQLLSPLDRPQWSWEKVPLKLCRPVRRAQMFLITGKGLEVRPINVAPFDGCLASFLKKKYNLNSINCGHMYNGPLWWVLPSTPHRHVITASSGGADLQVFLDVCTASGCPYDVYYFVMPEDYCYPGCEDNSQLVRWPLPALKDAINERVSPRGNAFWRAAQQVLYARNTALLDVDLIFPDMLNFNPFEEIAIYPAYFNMWDEYAEYDSKTGEWRQIFLNPEDLTAYKTFLVRKANDEVEHPVRVLEALRKLEREHPKVAEYFKNLFGEEPEEEPEEESPKGDEDY